MAGRIDESRSFQPVRIAVMTVSDTRGEAEDTSGRTLAELIKRDGHELVDRAIVKDDVAAITAKLRSWIADPGIEVVISTGGTYLFALPGSPGACRDGWEDVLRWQLDIRHRPCNLAELMPRLQEHLKK